MKLWILLTFAVTHLSPQYFVLTCVRYLQVVKLLSVMATIPFYELTSSRYNGLSNSHISSLVHLYNM